MLLILIHLNSLANVNLVIVSKHLLKLEEILVGKHEFLEKKLHSVKISLINIRIRLTSKKVKRGKLNQLKVVNPIVNDLT